MPRFWLVHPRRGGSAATPVGLRSPVNAKSAAVAANRAPTGRSAATAVPAPRRRACRPDRERPSVRAGPKSVHQNWSWEGAGADEGAAQEEGGMDVGAALVAHRQAAHAGQPGERAFDDPAMPPQPRAGIDALAAMRTLM